MVAVGVPPRAGQWAVLLVVGGYFTVPALAAAEFSLRDNTRHDLSAYGRIMQQPGFGSSLRTSLVIALGTVVLTLALLVPTATWVHLRLPQLRRVMEAVTLLPLVIPAVVLVTGVLSAYRSVPFLVGSTRILVCEYVVLALPFSYRTLDTGLAAIDLRTLVEASRSLGAGWRETLLRVVVPNIRTAVVGAVFLTFALVMGEYTVASLMLFDTFPTWLVRVGQEDAAVSVATSLLSLLLVWLLLLGLTSSLSRRRSGRRSS